MEVKVRVKKIKQCRQQRMMSQEELAIACGVGLRTIQRVEATGSASTETVRSLSAVFECDPQTLVDDGKGVTPYYNTQLGYAVLAVLFAVAFYFTWLFTQQSMSVPVFAGSIVLLAVFIAGFATLTVRVDDNQIRWHFGLGLIRKSLDIRDIQAASVVRNKAWWGLGIRRYETGWLYCVSGLNAVELQLKRGGTVRIGSDEPEKLHQAVNNVIEHSR